jgi:hypothetical protein
MKVGHYTKAQANSEKQRELSGNASVQHGLQYAPPLDSKIGHLGITGMTEKPPVLEALLRSKDAARILGMSEWSLRNLAHSGELAYIQHTPRSPMLFDPLDLRGWIERQKIRK